MRPLSGTLLHALVKTGDRDSAGGRIAANLVERQEAVKTIERRVLQRFCHHRAGELLNLEREAPVAGDAMADTAGSDQIERERIAEEIENAHIRAEPLAARLGDCALDDRAILPARA